ncbi:MAG: hypothetical protein ABL923_07085 [Burkholderiaceae bacterium]
MSFLTIDGAAELFVREWQKLYKRSPIATIISTTLVLLVGGTGIFLAERNGAAEREAKRLQSQSYVSQAQLLDETRVNLRALLSFIEDEQRNLKNSEMALITLKREHDQLKPLIDSDRKTIDALFSAQEARNKSAQSNERWIGFALGVISSLVASLILAIFAHVRRRSRNTPAS